MSSSEEIERSETGSTGPRSLQVGAPPRSTSSESDPSENVDHGYTPGSPDYTPASPEYSPVSLERSSPPPNPRRAALRPTGPRMKFTARKRTGILPRGFLSPRQVPLSQSLLQTGEPCSAAAPGKPPSQGMHHIGESSAAAAYRVSPARAPIDIGSQQRLWMRLDAHQAHIRQVTHREEETHTQLKRTNAVTRRLEQEVSELRAEMRAMRERKGLISRIWSWFRKGT